MLLIGHHSTFHALPLPRLGTENLPIRDNLLDGTTRSVHCPADNGRTPIVRHRSAGKLHTEEDHDSADGKTDVESGRGDVVVLHPPSEVLASDVLVEDEANHAP